MNGGGRDEDEERDDGADDDLAAALLDLAELRPLGGIYHAANEGQCSWHQFAVDILRERGARGLWLKELRATRS